MKLRPAIDALSSSIRDAHKGLPEEVFLLISRLTPMCNVDLLIQHPQKGTLLAWREDQYYGPGWHVPGGIIRYKEAMAARVHAVAEIELGAEVDFEPLPIAVNEMIVPEQRERAHFIALLFRCSLRGAPDGRLRFRAGRPKRGEWAWHEHCPKDLIRLHQCYAAAIG
jgi:ADP-ribose pyrophosphatase YjhB (NUDIX family)